VRSLFFDYTKAPFCACLRRIICVSVTSPVNSPVSILEFVSCHSGLRAGIHGFCYVLILDAPRLTTCRGKLIRCSIT